MVPDTAGNIVNAAAVQLGLVPFSAKLADPFGSTDGNIGQLCQLLVSLGRDLRKARQWNHLRRTYIFNTAMFQESSNQGLFALPADYGQYIDQTGWNRTNRLPLLGPLSPQEMQRLKAMLVGVTFSLLFEVLQGQFQAFPDVAPPDYVIAYEYVSSFWVIPDATKTSYGYPGFDLLPWTNGENIPNTGTERMHGGNIYSSTGGGTAGTYGPVGTTGTISDGSVSWTFLSAQGTTAPTASTDLIYFEPELVTMGLKYRWKKEKGLDYTAAEEDYFEALARAQDDDATAQKLNLTGEINGVPLIGQQSIPWTNFGV